MPYPPAALPPTGQTDGTASGTGHHADVLHNRTGQALADIVGELGNDPSGTATSVQARLDAMIPDHMAAADPHPGYRLESAPITAADVAADVATQAELDAEKVLRRQVILWAAVGYTATNAPAGGMEPAAGIGGTDWVGRAWVDARRASHFRTWHVLTATVAANGVRFEYSTDNGTTWVTLLDAGAGNGVSLSVWTAFPDAAKVGSLALRVMVYGDGVADPSLRRAEVEFGQP